MTMKSTKTLRALMLALSLVLLPVFAAAKETTASGSATYIPISETKEMLPNGMTMTRLTSKCLVISDDESVDFHLAPQISTGSILSDANGKVLMSMGYGETIDADGDVMVIWWRGNETGSVWGFMGGTGKYEGIAGGGTSENIVLHSDGSQHIRWEGVLRIAGRVRGIPARRGCACPGCRGRRSSCRRGFA